MSRKNKAPAPNPDLAFVRHVEEAAARTKKPTLVGEGDFRRCVHGADAFNDGIDALVEALCPILRYRGVLRKLHKQMDIRAVQEAIEHVMPELEDDR